jgi:hypothetical protein
LLNKENDLYALLIATPQFLDTEISIAALSRGLIAVCEKPLATKVEGANRVVEAVKKSGKIFQIGQHWRYTPVYETIGALVRQGAVGPVGGRRRRQNQPARSEVDRRAQTGRVERTALLSIDAAVWRRPQPSWNVPGGSKTLTARLKSWDAIRIHERRPVIQPPFVFRNRWCGWSDLNRHALAGTGT